MKLKHQFIQANPASQVTQSGYNPGLSVNRGDPSIAHACPGWSQGKVL